MQYRSMVERYIIGRLVCSQPCPNTVSSIRTIIAAIMYDAWHYLLHSRKFSDSLPQDDQLVNVSIDLLVCTLAANSQRQGGVVF